jgi:UDP-N-acetylglucosamine 2-epimerase (non-hydrolysing)
MPRVLVVIGTRPEAIKMAPVVAALRARSDEVETRVALTGQHTQLVDQVLEAFALDPAYDLGIMKEGQSLYDVVHGALDGLRGVVRDFEPDVLLVQGDTATVFVGSLVGFFERVKVGHVEAGLRSHDKWAPFPEEIFRRLTDVVSDYYFAPTAHARDALLAEGTPAGHVFVTGNTVVDALLTVTDSERPVADPALRAAIEGDGRFVLLTAHRRESFGAPIREVFGAVRTLADEFDDIEVVYPVHPNPNVLEPARELLSDHPRIHLTEPVGYFDLVRALREASLILTDSGGIQEEAPTFGTPVLVLREVTERPEGVDAGVTELVGTDAALILERSLAALAREGGSAPPPNPYGDGQAGARIADIVISDLTGAPRLTEDLGG